MAGKSAPTTIEIFRPGTHTSMAGDALAFSESDLRATADGYNPAIHEAPIVIGHPAHDMPAYGWVADLAFADGGLQATPRQVNPEFAEMVKTGAFKKVSAAFYTPSSKGNPAPGAYYLRHLGFLGALPPAVKGLRPATFADDDDGVVTIEFGDVADVTVGWSLKDIGRLFQRLRDWIVETDGAEKAEQILPSWSITQIIDDGATVKAEADKDEAPSFSEPEPKPQSKESAVNSAEDIAKREEDLAAREAAFAEKEAVARRADNEALLDGLIADGRLRPSDKVGLAQFMEGLDHAETARFGEGDAEADMTPLGFFRDYLGKLPRIVHFGELADGDGAASPEADNGEEIAKAAVAFQEEQAAKGVVVSTIDAVDHVTKGAKT